MKFFLLFTAMVGTEFETFSVLNLYSNLQTTLVVDSTQTLCVQNILQHIITSMITM